MEYISQSFIRIKLMMANIVTFIFLICNLNLIQAQITITITSLPSNTPPDAEIYIAGNFNSWSPGNVAYQLTDNHNGSYSITFSPNPGVIQYKFTRGSWETVEGNANGGFIPNRTYTYTGGVQTFNVAIAGWEDISGMHTAEANVEILDEAFFMPELNRNRRIWLYLPPDYHSTSKRYPVIYAQDGQNLFDAFYSFSGEWKIDESMNDLFDQGDYGAIVVGIDNGGSERINEYSPWVNPSYGGGNGEAYSAFLVQTLKPYIDEHYRTLSGREFTAIAGSSLGANISMYTAIEYQETFGKVGIFSPAFWFSDSSYLHIQNKGIEDDLRIYFVAGQNESSGMIPDMMEMYNSLATAGQDENQMHLVNRQDGAHSEWFWAREYPFAYEWLFDGLTLSTQPTTSSFFSIFPNPTKHDLQVSPSSDGMRYNIYSPLGNLLSSDWVLHGAIDTSGLPNGFYVLEIMDPLLQTVAVTRFIKQ